MSINISTELKVLLSALDSIENAIQKLPEDSVRNNACQSLEDSVRNNACQLLELNVGNIRNIVLQKIIPLVWGLENGLHISVPQDINDQSTNTLIDITKKKWVELVPCDDSHMGGRLIIYIPNNNPVILSLTEIEYDVVSQFQDSALTNKSPLKLNEIRLPYNAPQIRSALHRVIDKLKEAQCPWVLTNVKRHGYILKMKQDDQI